MGIMRQNAMPAATAGPGCPVEESFDPLSPEFLADPYAVMASLPGAARPVFFAPSIGYYVVTSYDAVEHVFRDPAAYSAAVAQAPLTPIVPEAQRILLGGGYKPQPTMVSLDEPEHARLRKPAARAFSVKRVTALIPANIVFSLMGVPEKDYAQLKQWCGYRAALAWGRPAPDDQVEIATNMAV